MSRFSLNSISNYLPAWSLFGRNPSKTDGRRSISSLISHFQFTRLKHDIQGWREAIGEMELAYYPQRVKAQRIYMDTVLNPHVHACINRRNELVLLKEFGLFNGEVCDEKATERLKADWFNNLIAYSLEADLFGYSLIELGDMVNDSFPHLRLIPRENVNPDREILSSIVYQLNGENFTDPSNQYYDWCIWVNTPSDKGSSPCGYGILYKIANLEIFLRNLLGSNATYNDNYGQPLRHGKTSKTEGKEYDEFCRMLDEMGENAWAVTDPTDEIEFIQATSGNGAGFKTYDNFEQRLEKKISKVLLGHADAIDSVPGKLGAGQGGNESPAAQSMEDLETKKAKFIETLVNSQVIPKLIKIGFPIAPGLVFKYKNNKEKEEIREKKDKSLKATADAVKTLSDAGWEVEEKWLNEHTEVPMKRKEAPKAEENPQKFSKQIENKLKETYGEL